MVASANKAHQACEPSSAPNRRCNPRSRIAAEGAGAILVGVILGAAGRGQDAQVVDRVLRHRPARAALVRRAERLKLRLLTTVLL